VYVGSFTGPGGTANCTASVQISYGTITGGSGDVVTPNPAPINSGTGFTNTGGTGGNTSGGVTSALVQCGVGGGIANSTSCQACDLAKLVSNIINFLIGISIPLAAGLFAWAGILYFTSGADPKNFERAKGIFSNAFIGFLIVITAWLVINTLLQVLLTGGSIPQNSWFTVQCSTVPRPVSGNINQVINSVLPGVPTPQMIIDSGFSAFGGGGGGGGGSGGAYSCASGYSLDNGTGYVDESGNSVGSVSCVKTDTQGNVLDEVAPGCGSGYAIENGATSIESNTYTGRCINSATGVAATPLSPQDLISAGTGECTPDNIQQAAGANNEGTDLTTNEAATLSCIAIRAETGCRGIPNAEGASSAYGYLQVLRNNSNENYQLNYQSCVTAASNAGYTNVADASGNLNCGNYFSKATCIGTAAQCGACNAASANFTCQSQAAAGLVADKFQSYCNKYGTPPSGNYLFGDWLSTQGGNPVGRQAQCVQGYVSDASC
jgi:hypothetical protein